MPKAPPSLCNVPGCYRLAPPGRRRCASHQADAELERKAKDHRRGSAAARGYDHRWRGRRARFLRAHPLCVDPFGRHPDQVVPATVVDHIIPHRGDRELFDDADNWQALCVECHGEKTARGE